jgi:rRNA maturation endonuclease Nob1
MVPTIVAVVLAAAALVFTLWVRREDIPEPLPASPTLHLEERKARIYEGLRDLQFEYRLGKLSDEDYQKTKLGLQRELSATLAQLDAVTGGAPVPAPAKKAAAVAAPSNGTVDKAAGWVKDCPHCGANFPQPLKFCGQCGKVMA